MRPSEGPLTHVDHPLAEALARMRGAKETFAPVVDGEQIVGILDVDRLAAFPRKARNDRRRLSVRDRMTNAVPFLYEDDPLPFADAVARVTGHAHFCVIDRGRRLAGLLSFAGPHALALDWSLRTLEIDESTARARIAVTPARAASSSHGQPVSYADRPVLVGAAMSPDHLPG
jgi:hypothetical protein